MLRLLTTRITSLATVALVLLVGIGAALSGNLPGGVQDVVAEAAGAVGVDVPTSGDQVPLPDAGNSSARADRVSEVLEAIDDHTKALNLWTTCVAEASRGRGDLQRDPETRSTGEGADRTAECGPKPKLDPPRSADRRSDNSQDRDQSDKPDRSEKPEKPEKSDK